jgi:hypothetical protein
MIELYLNFTQILKRNDRTIYKIYIFLIILCIERNVRKNYTNRNKKKRELFTS